MDITVNINGAELTICPAGRIDTTTAPQLKSVVDENIGGVTKLTFDFEKLNYISSAGLRVLMSARKTMNNQGEMKIINVNDDIMDVFDMTGLTELFNIG
ncbi:MAG TPA: anti-sigma factor antagonist [Ruminococcaceae bacterium]|nr:anti-sigma factor antagonist [Oscillospiraceae bacterium]